MSFFSTSLKRYALLAGSLAPIVLTGCALSPSGSTVDSSAIVSGRLMGGSQPIVGATVNLYATGSSYGAGNTLLGTATTTSTGWTITRNGATCSDPQQVYLVASGGNAGAGVNSASVLVAALGTCSSITTATTGLTVNEATTVAAAYALQGFANSTAIGAPNSNSQGLKHAFANALTLVGRNGAPNQFTPGGNGTIPVVVINTVANILAACVNSAGVGSTGCTAAFQGTPTAVSATLPTNTWDEALDIARYPGYQVANLFTAIQGYVPYQASLATAPNDFSIGIPYSAGFQTDGATAATFPWDVKADSSDNIWVTGMTKAGLVELSPNGTVLSPSGGWGNATLQAAFTHGVAFDLSANQNVWAADTAGNVWEYTPAGTATTPTLGTTTQFASSVVGPAAIGVDASNTVWFGTYSGTASTSQGFGKITNGATAITFPSNSAYSSTAVKGTYTLFVDAANGNQVYAGSQSAGVTYQYLSPTAAVTATTSLGSSATNGLAVDKSKNLWVVYTGSGSNGGSLVEYASGATTPTVTCKVTVTTGAGLYNPRGIVIDGNNRFFITSYTTPGIVAFDPAIGTACDATGDPGTFFTTSVGNGINPSNNAGTGIMAVSAARNETVDSSGALWTINGTSTAGYQPVVEILGIAAPTNPVLAAGKYGVKP
jgi:sugar lactone lactonase YvrE